MPEVSALKKLPVVLAAKHTVRRSQSRDLRYQALQIEFDGPLAVPARLAITS